MINRSPARTSFMKYRKGNITGVKAQGGLLMGDWGLQVRGCGRLTGQQIEAARKVLSRKLDRQGKVWIRVFTDYPVTSKPSEVRMGKGKGARDWWAARVRKGQMIFEVSGVEDIKRVVDALSSAGKKRPLECVVVDRPEGRL